MVTVEIHEAKNRLSQRVDQEARGEPFIIAKAGKSLVKVIALDAPAPQRRIGFLQRNIKTPDDFDRTGEAEMAAMFEDEV